MEYFLNVYKNHYADFSGRARRSEYWYFQLFYVITLLIALAIDFMIGFPVAYLIVALGSIVPALGVMVRRLHDTDKSGWFALISLIPIVGSIALIVFLATDGTPGSNKYGSNPKGLMAGDDVARHLVGDEDSFV
ncbi:UNVERIFIED_CONTAM: hypothetical protein GTU68_008751 [Idotea baltica]|nr:hypothetical protein [Idotea baltica]